MIAAGVLVVGGGGAGLRAAIAAAETGADVLLVSKARVGYRCNTFLAKGAIAAAEGDPRDNPDVHFEDTMRGGRGLNDPALVALMTGSAPGELRVLERCGVPFFRNAEGGIFFRHTPGHTFARNARTVRQDGRDFVLPLREAALARGVRFLESTLVTDVVVRDGRVVGATALAADGTRVGIEARSVVLATGGYGQAYRNNDNAAGATGDGHAIALRAGAELTDMEFVQFYPTALGPRGTTVLLYEGFVFGAGAVLRNSLGEDIVARHGLGGTLAMTRDRLSRAIAQEIEERRGVDHGVVMDLADVPAAKMAELAHLLPGSRGARRSRYVVSPTVHFCMGGVITDTEGATGIGGLYAAGEIGGGMHGANRLGGNSLAAVFVMGGAAGRAAALSAREVAPRRLSDADVVPGAPAGGGTGPRPAAAMERLRSLMWQSAGILRSASGLETALAELDAVEAELAGATIADAADLWRVEEARAMLLVSRAVCGAALLRRESRGAHFRRDHPDESEAWVRNIGVRLHGRQIEARLTDRRGAV
jgi:succinate dehydrogenase/fumarate reductase flavoprotein subunit